jgi:hypothetical protein
MATGKGADWRPSAGGTPTDRDGLADWGDMGVQGPSQVYGEDNGGTATPFNAEEARDSGFYNERDGLTGSKDPTWSRDSATGPDVPFAPSWGSFGDSAPSSDARQATFGDAMSQADLAGGNF